MHVLETFKSDYDFGMTVSFLIPKALWLSSRAHFFYHHWRIHKLISIRAVDPGNIEQFSVLTHIFIAILDILAIGKL